MVAGRDPLSRRLQQPQHYSRMLKRLGCSCAIFVVGVVAVLRQFLTGVHELHIMSLFKKQSINVMTATQDYNDVTKPESAIFYNIYINPRNTSNGIRIISEQTSQIFQLLSSQRNHSNQPLPSLYYNMIGYNYSQRFCPLDMNCTLLKYYDTGFEEVTLHDLQQYCMAHPGHNVFYVHNKGSYTVEPFNERLRRNVTDFLFRSGLNILLEHRNGTCNMVAMRWHPYPWWHVRANMWGAKCSYIRNLIPVLEYQNVRTKMFEHILQPENYNKTSPIHCLGVFFPQAADITKHRSGYRHVEGIGRYSYEIWMANHPDLVPCDQDDEFFHTTALDLGTSHHKKVWGTARGLMHHDWFRMYGRLYELYYLYQKIPAISSFFWKYYEGTEEPQAPFCCRQGTCRKFRNYFAQEITDEITKRIPLKGR